MAAPAATTIALALLVPLIAWLAVGVVAHPERLAVFALALACGGALSVYGLRKTKFEAVPGMLYYAPNAHLGIALSLLFLGRILYRAFEMYSMPAGTATGEQFARSPLTLAVFGLLAGYYIGYAIGLLAYRRRVLRAKAEREAQS